MGGGEGVGWWCLLVALLLPESKERASEFSFNRVAWPEKLCFPVDVPEVEAESEQSLPGEDDRLAYVDLQGHLFPGVIGSHAGEWLHSYHVEWGVGAKPDTAHRWHDCGLPGCLPVLSARDGPPGHLMASSGFCSKIYWFSTPWGFISSLSFWQTAWLAVSYCAEISLFSLPSSSGWSGGFLSQFPSCCWLPSSCLVWPSSLQLLGIQFLPRWLLPRVPVEMAPWLVEYMLSICTFFYLM